jgi:hypothetical protein
MLKESELRAGCLYRVDRMDDSRYEVCIGKIPVQTSCYAFMELGLVPTGATLETFPINRLANYAFNQPRRVIIHQAMWGIMEYARMKYTYLGHICEPTEQAIKAWITQLKLSGYIIDNQVLPGITILGDWNKREKLPCVQRFRKGSIYVEEELAYIRTRTEYVDNDIIWRYIGKQGKYFVWQWKFLKDTRWRPHEKYEKQLENMVVFRTDESWHHVVKER